MGKAYSANAVLAVKILMAALTLYAGLQSPAYCDNASAAFQPGEKLAFSLRWGVIPAGTAELKVMPTEAVNGVNSYHFVLTASSNSFFDVFYKVRDRIDSFADTALSHSTLYKKKQHEGGTHRNIEVAFDWEKQVALYSNSGKENKITPLAPGSFDPLAIFYYIRSIDIKEKDVIERPATDGKKTVTATASVVARQTVSTPAGNFEAFLIESELKYIGGELKKRKATHLKIWLTADRRKIPVKVEIGNFVGELISAQDLGASDNEK